jgi:F0F1-type ATP synthase assembly protein I
VRGPPPRRAAAAWGRTFEGALEAGLSVVIGVVAGYYADRWLGTTPLLLILLMLAGGVAAVRRLLQLAKPEVARDPAASSRDSSPSGSGPVGPGRPESGDGDRDRDAD